MNTKNFILSIALTTILSNAVFAIDPSNGTKPFDINSIEYIEDEISFDLGFDTADYLPEGFDPYELYVDLQAVEYIEEEVTLEDLSKYLPANFDAYAYPTSIAGMNYIDKNDFDIIDFDTKKHLPEGFNAYIR